MTTLKNVLLINAVSSGATGLGLIIFPGLIAGLFETVETSPFLGVGFFLFAFAIMVFTVSRRNPVNEKGVWLIIVLDCLWVVTSVCILLLQLFPISLLGYFFIAAVAAWVALMAFLQYNTLKKLVL